MHGNQHRVRRGGRGRAARLDGSQGGEPLRQSRPARSCGCRRLAGRAGAGLDRHAGADRGSGRARRRAAANRTGRLRPVTGAGRLEGCEADRVLGRGGDRTGFAAYGGFERPAASHAGALIDGRAVRNPAGCAPGRRDLHQCALHVALVLPIAACGLGCAIAGAGCRTGRDLPPDHRRRLLGRARGRAAGPAHGR
ncbi:hypothetical protein VARIO8X_90664 [Burkholderiales bacterium 8X]|nr:hypothetical protein VARIO8X_90664 [Burkholderiales bacterium 8X]